MAGGIRQLTIRNKKTGALYQRLPEVDQQILAGMLLDTDALAAWAEIADPKAPEFMKDECVVYFLREHHWMGDKRVVERLTGVLHARCLRYAKFELKQLEQRMDREDVCQEAECSLHRDIVDLRSEKSDFLEVYFRLAFQRRLYSALRPHQRRASENARTVPMEKVAGMDSGSNDEDGPHYSLPQSLLEDGPSMDQRLLIDEGLSVLPEPIRSTFVLYHYVGLPIESSDPTVPTISRGLGVTPRTVRNRLEKAECLLKEYRGDKS